MNIKFKHCKACGFPMLEPRDFGGGDEKNTWCKNCCDENGNHLSFEELVENMSSFLLTKEGEETSDMKFKSKSESKEFATNYLKKQPAFNEK